jgi:hypothetical protein
MAEVDFPNNPEVGELFTVGNRTWRWTGVVWETVTTSIAVGPQGPKGDKGDPALINLIGEYDNGYDYQIDDVVTFNGSLYLRVGEPNVGFPPTDTDYWLLILAKGQDGEDGLDGPQGPQGLPGLVYPAETLYTGTLTVSPNAPSGGNDGDLWFRYYGV